MGAAVVCERASFCFIVLLVAAIVLGVEDDAPPASAPHRPAPCKRPSKRPTAASAASKGASAARERPCGCAEVRKRRGETRRPSAISRGNPARARSGEIAISISISEILLISPAWEGRCACACACACACGGVD